MVLKSMKDSMKDWNQPVTRGIYNAKAEAMQIGPSEGVSDAYNHRREA